MLTKKGLEKQQAEGKCVTLCQATKQVSMLGPLLSRTKKQMVSLLVGMCKLSKLFQFWPEPLYKAIPFGVQRN